MRGEKSGYFCDPRGSAKNTLQRLKQMLAAKQVKVVGQYVLTKNETGEGPKINALIDGVKAAQNP